MMKHKEVVTQYTSFYRLDFFVYLLNKNFFVFSWPFLLGIEKKYFVGNEFERISDSFSLF